MLRTCIVIVCLVPALWARADIPIDDFEDVSDWSGLDLGITGARYDLSV